MLSGCHRQLAMCVLFDFSNMKVFFLGTISICAQVTLSASISGHESNRDQKFYFDADAGTLFSRSSARERAILTEECWWEDGPPATTFKSQEILALKAFRGHSAVFLFQGTMCVESMATSLCMPRRMWTDTQIKHRHPHLYQNVENCHIHAHLLFLIMKLFYLVTYSH